MIPALQEILHNITTLLATLEQNAQSDKLLIDLIQEQCSKIGKLRKEWVKLTDMEIINTANEAPFDQMVKADDYIYIIARAIEAALRSKNT